MSSRRLSAQQKKAVEKAVAHFDEHRHLFDGFAKSVLGYLRDDAELAPYIHFIKYRLKSSDRLRTKLTTKALGAVGPVQRISPSNLFQRINDLAGIRILHLYTNQIGEIDKHIKRILKANKIEILEGPTVHCWDRDYEGLFAQHGILSKAAPSEDLPDSMYTSVHYILGANQKSKITFELQVRTLADELWGEVSHRVAYQQKKPEQLVENQLKVLARLTSASSRLVDCIFDSWAGADDNRGSAAAMHSQGVMVKRF